MRIGHNPNKDAPAPAQLKGIVLHIVTHLPELTGYHAQRLQIIKTCITSMINGIHTPHSVIITDNRSVPELTDWIQNEVKPLVFMHSQNLGKKAQRKLVAQMLPPKTVLCYSDDDMLFYDNWFAPQYELLKGFPNVAAVTGYPVRTAFRWGVGNTLQWCKANAKVESGRFISEQEERDFCVSIGRDWEGHKANTRNDIDYRVTYKGLTAYTTAHHCQQIGYAGTIAKAIEFDGRAMGEERTFDERLDLLGLRLATTTRLCRHIGNVMDAGIIEAIEQNKIETTRLIGTNIPMEAK